MTHSVTLLDAPCKKIILNMSLFLFLVYLEFRPGLSLSPVLTCTSRVSKGQIILG